MVAAHVILFRKILCENFIGTQEAMIVMFTIFVKCNTCVANIYFMGLQLYNYSYSHIAVEDRSNVNCES